MGYATVVSVTTTSTFDRDDDTPFTPEDTACCDFASCLPDGSDFLNNDEFLDLVEQHHIAKNDPMMPAGRLMRLAGMAGAQLWGVPAPPCGGFEGECVETSDLTVMVERARTRREENQGRTPCFFKRAGVP